MKILLFLFVFFFSSISLSNMKGVADPPIVTQSDSKSIVKILNSDESIIDNDMVSILTRFKATADNIEVIEKLSINGERLAKHVDQQLSYPMKREELLVYLEALSLVNNIYATELLLSIGKKRYNDIELSLYLARLFREMALTENIAAYFDLLINENPDNGYILPVTLLSIVLSESPEVKRLSAQYRSPGINPNVRFMGLYLSSLLGKDKILQQWILQILFDDTSPPTYQHYYLLIALSRQMTDENFYDFLSRSYVDSNTIKSVKLERKFYQGDTKTRMNLALKLANSSHPDQSIAAISFLLKEQGFEKTWQQLNQQQRLSAIRLSYKLSIPVFIEKDNKKLTNSDGKIENTSLGNLYYLYWVIVGLAVIVLLWRSVIFNKKSSID